MIHKVSNLLTEHLCKNASLSLDDTEKLNYAIFSILSESIKIIFLLLFFILLGKINYFLLSFGITFSIRIFAGGHHFQGFMKCLLFSLLFFIFTCILIIYIPSFFTKIYYFILIICIIITMIYAPRPSKNRPIISTKRILCLRILSTISTLIWVCILIFFIKDINLFKCGFMTILLQSIELLPINKEAFK